LILPSKATQVSDSGHQQPKICRNWAGACDTASRSITFLFHPARGGVLKQAIVARRQRRASGWSPKRLRVLDSPHICTIHEIGETDSGELVIAMNFYEGRALKGRYLRRSVAAG